MLGPRIAVLVALVATTAALAEAVPTTATPSNAAPVVSHAGGRSNLDRVESDQGERGIRQRKHQRLTHQDEENVVVFGAAEEEEDHATGTQRWLAGENPDDELQDDNQDDTDIMDKPWMKNGGWILLVIGTLAMFYGLAVVVEDFFVPALNVMCDRFDIPDDVAGATFMAAGASSPEMFSAFISLFITGSSLGAGTIIGSEIFNHLIICAGSVLYSKGGVIQLDWRLVGREVFFYSLALGLLLYSLSIDTEDSSTYPECSRVVEASSLRGEDKFCIYWYQALVLLMGYVAYALVCAYYQQLIACVCPKKRTGYAGASDRLGGGGLGGGKLGGEGSGSLRQGLIDGDSIDDYARSNESGEGELEEGARGLVPRKQNTSTDQLSSRVTLSLQYEPVENIRPGVDPRMYASFNEDGDETMTHRPSQDPATLFMAAMGGKTLGRNLFASLEETEGGVGDAFYGCYLWKRSRFYSKMRFSRHAWQLRWVTIDENGFRSFRERNSSKGVRAFNVYQAYRVEEFDTSRLILWLSTPQGSLYFQAPSEQVFHEVIEVLRLRISQFRTLSSAQRSQLHSESIRAPLSVSVDRVSNMDLSQLREEKVAMAESNRGSLDAGDEDHHSLIAWPQSSSFFSVGGHLFLLPMKALLYYTVPDVRLGSHGEKKWPGAIAMCFLWLIGLSFIMTECLEKLGEHFNINSLTMGMTVSAAGTSFPNVFASMVVAKQGLGNMAVSNALGGNVFNVFMGLGLPWLLYTLLGGGNDDVNEAKHMYFGMDSGGVTFPVIVLLALIAGYMLLLISTGWRLYTSHAYVFISLYVGFLMWVFCFHTISPFGN